MRRGSGAGIEKETQGAAKPTLESRCFRQARRRAPPVCCLAAPKAPPTPSKSFHYTLFPGACQSRRREKVFRSGRDRGPYTGPGGPPPILGGGEKNGTFFQPPEGACQQGNCPSTAETFASGTEKFRFFAKRPKFLEHDFHFCWKRKKQKTLRTKRQDFLENLCRCAKILTFNDRPKAAASGQTYDLRSGKKWIT